MAVSSSRQSIVLTAASDEVRMNLQVRQVRWVAGSTSQGGDRMVLVDPINTSNVLVELTANGADYSETYPVHRRWHKGARVSVLDAGTVYIEYD